MPGNALPPQPSRKPDDEPQQEPEVLAEVVHGAGAAALTEGLGPLYHVDGPVFSAPGVDGGPRLIL